jgi:ribonuclease P protein component
VKRNRVKRRVREWFRRGQGGLAPELDLVVIARRGATTLDQAGVDRELAVLVAEASR